MIDGPGGAMRERGQSSASESMTIGRRVE